MPKIEWGDLTEEETLQIFKEAMGYLNVFQVSHALLDVFDEDGREEIAAQIDTKDQ